MQEQQALEELKDLLLSADRISQESDFDKLRNEMLLKIEAVDSQIKDPVNFARNIENSREHIIDVLGPMIGKIIRKGIMDEIEKLNKRIGSATSSITDLTNVKNKFRALFGLKPKVDFTRLGYPEIIDILAIDKESGILLGKYSSDEHADSDIIAGMLSAIKSFSETAFNTNQGELDLIDYDGYKIKLQAYGSIYYAIIIEGRYTPEFKDFITSEIENFTTNYYLILQRDQSKEEIQKNLSSAMQNFFKETCEKLEKKLSS